MKSRLEEVQEQILNLQKTLSKADSVVQDMAWKLQKQKTMKATARESLQSLVKQPVVALSEYLWLRLMYENNAVIKDLQVKHDQALEVCGKALKEIEGLRRLADKLAEAESDVQPPKASAKILEFKR